MAATNRSSKISATTRILVWLCRIIAGATFAISGWAKAVDPWGFIYKISDYLTVWSVEFPRELVLTAAISLSVAEFAVGVALLTGSMRKSSVWIAAIFMAFMLPLTAYIALFNPVSDCGCFGDFIVLSNNVTFFKNVVLAVLIVYLLINNQKVSGIYVESAQLIPMAASICFVLLLAYTGYYIQPLVDFRPFPVGVSLIEEDEESVQPKLIYSKDGRTREFEIDNLPDSTWTFVDALIDNQSDAHRFVITDQGEEVTSELIEPHGDLLILAIPDPRVNYLNRARLANELCRHMSDNGGSMIAVIAAEDEQLDEWRDLALPTYSVYSAEDTEIKELARGDASLVYIRNGVILWKRNMASISHDIISSDATFKDTAINHFLSSNRKANLIITAIYLAIMLVAMIKFHNFAKPKKRLNYILNHEKKYRCRQLENEHDPSRRRGPCRRS